MRYSKAKRQRDIREVFNFEDGDPVFGKLVPRLWETDEAKNYTGLHPELRKLVYSTQMESSNYGYELDLESERDA